jgi:hypothetical protein
MLALLLGASQVLAATYYVDFEGGNDGNDGRSPAAPWKHAPGDPAARRAPAAIALRPADTVLFKGATAYRGNIVLTRSGSAGSPITYKGDGWGSARAVMEGADPYESAWTACPSAAACGDNPNFAKIYFAGAPAGYPNFLAALYENGEFLWYSQSPNPADPFYHDDIGSFHIVPHPVGEVIQSQSAISDPRTLKQSSPSFWDGAAVAGWVTGNVVEIRPVTRFDPRTHTLHHQPFSNAPYKDRPGRYALMNHVALIDRPGESAFDRAARRISLWPRSGASPGANTYSVGTRDSAFASDAAVSHLVIEGFAIRRYASGVLLASGAGSNVTVRNNDVAILRAHDRYAIQVNAKDSLVEGNRIRDANRAVGILSSADGITVRNNHVERASRQGIWFMGARNSRIVGNTVVDIGGSHANGISIYSGSVNIVVEGNRVLRTPSAITFEKSADLAFANNIVAPDGQISDWFGMTGTVAFYNNTFAGSHFVAASDIDYVFRNNVVRQPPPRAARSYNVFTSTLAAALQRGEVVETDLGKLFVAPSAGDFRPRRGGKLIDAGTEVPVTTDIDGKPRPQGKGWDIGAHEGAE